MLYIICFNLQSPSLSLSSHFSFCRLVHPRTWSTDRHSWQAISLSVVTNQWVFRAFMIVIQWSHLHIGSQWSNYATSRKSSILLPSQLSGAAFRPSPTSVCHGLFGESSHTISVFAEVIGLCSSDYQRKATRKNILPSIEVNTIWRVWGSLSGVETWIDQPSAGTYFYSNRSQTEGGQRSPVGHSISISRHLSGVGQIRWHAGSARWLRL